MTPIRIPIPDDCCAMARNLIADGLDPDTPLEFMRGDVVSLRGTARAFAGLMVAETGNGPRYVRYKPLDAKAKALLRKTVAPPMR